MYHPIKVSHFEFRVRNQRIINTRVLRFIYITNPFIVGIKWISANGNYLNVSLSEFRIELSHSPEFSGTNGGKVSRMREQNSPTVAKPFVKINCALCCFGSKIRSNISKSERHKI